MDDALLMRRSGVRFLKAAPPSPQVDPLLLPSPARVGCCGGAVSAGDVAGGRRPGRVEDSRGGVRIGDEDLGFQTVRVSEEQAEDGPEVGDELVAGAAGE